MNIIMLAKLRFWYEIKIKMYKIQNRDFDIKIVSKSLLISNLISN